MSSSNSEYIIKWLQDSEANIVFNCRAHFNQALKCGRELRKLIRQLHPAVRAIFLARNDPQNYQTLQQLPGYLRARHRFSTYAIYYNCHVLYNIRALFEVIQLNLAAIVPLMKTLRSLRASAKKRRRSSQPA